MAVQAALTVINYYQAPPDEVPPQEIWHHQERLDEWFESMKQNREARSRGMEPITEVPQEKNELADRLLGRS